LANLALRHQIGVHGERRSPDMKIFTIDEHYQVRAFVPTSASEAANQSQIECFTTLEELV
jgi:hypothetical protein